MILFPILEGKHSVEALTQQHPSAYPEGKLEMHNV